MLHSITLGGSACLGQEGPGYPSLRLSESHKALSDSDGTRGPTVSVSSFKAGTREGKLRNDVSLSVGA